MPILSFIMPFLSKALDLIPDPAQRAQQLQSIMQALQNWDAQQTSVNQVEAANSNLFVSGWRPFIGWICASALLYQYILAPFVLFGIALWNAHHTGAQDIAIPKLPTLDDNLWQLMFGMLGMGGLRTFEKMKGVSK